MPGKTTVPPETLTDRHLALCERTAAALEAAGTARRDFAGLLSGLPEADDDDSTLALLVAYRDRMQDARDRLDLGPLTAHLDHHLTAAADSIERLKRRGAFCAAEPTIPNWPFLERHVETVRVREPLRDPETYLLIDTAERAACAFLIFTRDDLDRYAGPQWPERLDALLRAGGLPADGEYLLPAERDPASGRDIWPAPRYRPYFEGWHLVQSARNAQALRQRQRDIDAADALKAERLRQAEAEWEQQHPGFAAALEAARSNPRIARTLRHILEG